ncbi:MAG: DMT family transporter [Patescibacteria group bacterium]
MFGFKHFRKGLLFALVAVFFGSIVTVTLRYLFTTGENPLNISAWILLLAAVPWLFLFHKHNKAFTKLSLKNILLLLFIGIAGSVGVNYMQSLALANTSAINFAFLYRTIIVFTIIFAWLFLNEKLTWRKCLLVVIILVGSYLITTDGSTFSLSAGDIYTLIMAAAAAFISNILIKHTMSKMHPDLSGSVTSLVACLSLVILAYTSNVFSIPQHFVFVCLASVCYFALIMLRNRAYVLSTASFVTMIFGLTPLFVTILSVIFLHETIEFIEIIGGILILTSAFFAEKYRV